MIKSNLNILYSIKQVVFNLGSKTKTPGVDKNTLKIYGYMGQESKSTARIYIKEPNKLRLISILTTYGRVIQTSNYDKKQSETRMGDNI